MIRVPITIMLVVAGSAWAQAPRLDGCIREELKQSSATLTGMTVPSPEARDQALRESGYSSTRESAISALHDSRPDVRSVAALKISSSPGNSDAAPLLAAWLAEPDDCSKSTMAFALSRALEHLHSPPGGLRRFPPFQPCTPSEPAMVSLTIKPELRYGPNKVQVTARNLTSQTLPFLGAREPSQILSMTVLSPTGEHAKVPIGQEFLYRPPEATPVVSDGHFLLWTDHAPTFQALPPNEEVPLWIWDIGSYFDITAPGIYRVSLGGRIDFLNTTICSNTFDLAVGDQRATCKTCAGQKARQNKGMQKGF